MNDAVGTTYGGVQSDGMDSSPSALPPRVTACLSAPDTIQDASVDEIGTTDTGQIIAKWRLGAASSDL